MAVLVTGGTGFVGSATVVALIEAGHRVHVVDDLTNSSDAVLDRIEVVTGIRPGFTLLDVRDRERLRRTMVDHDVTSIIHFAAHKHVGESMERPFEYYDNNLGGLAAVVDVARRLDVRTVVFSSSGSVYGDADRLPIPEAAPHRPTNPYSTTKSVSERILRDLCRVEADWSVMALRYFNPAGAHPSGLIGEDPTGLLSNLLPVCLHVAVGNLPHLTVLGDDFDTVDGTGVRDYVHVSDVARAHVVALEHLADRRGFSAYNIGRGEGVSVLQVVDAVERASGRAVPIVRGARRPGDVAALYADTSCAARILGLTDYQDLDAICADAWRWQSRNPKGYR
jgi:UDP-glucose 4-epimerase